MRFIEMSIKNLFQIKRNKNNGRISFGGFQDVIFHTFVRYIRATPKMILPPGQHLDGTTITETNNNIRHEYFTNETTDLMVNYYYLAFNGNESHVYPFMQSGLRSPD